jgi:hypothetical protein
VLLTPREPFARQERDRRVVPGLFALLLIYLIARVLLVPPDASIVGGFEHDAAYLSIVSAQVRDGHGLVNPADWLLFLWPRSLPMPYHNANPAFPLLMALVSLVFSVETARAALFISAVSSGILAVAVYSLASRYCGWICALLLTAGVVMFPINFADSLNAVPDALCTAFGVAALACVVRTEWKWSTLGAGVCLGISWLSRSSASLLILPMVWWLIRSRRDRMRAVLVLALSFIVVISPWLWYTWHVWGSPLRSDASYYLFQDYYANKSFGGDLDRYWRSLDLPPGLGAILRQDLKGFAGLYVHNVSYMAYIILAEVSEWSKLAAALYIAMAGLAAFQTRHLWNRAELQAGALLLLLSVGTLDIRAHSFEVRYLGPALVLLLLWVLVPVVRVIVRRPAGAMEWSAAMLGLGFVAVIGIQDVSEFRSQASLSSEMATFRNEDQQLQREIGGEDRVLIPKPYFYTLFTGRSALSPPNSDKGRLLHFMNYYSARYIAVPSAKLDYYYPWHSSFGPELRFVRTVGSLSVFEKTGNTL